MTPKEVLALIREKDVKAVDLRFMDFPGLWQHFTVPSEALTEATFAAGRAKISAAPSGFTWTGRARLAYTRALSEAPRRVSRPEVRAVDLRFMDFPGLWQHFTIPAEALTEATFEEGLGRRVPWAFRGHQLYLIPRAFPELNAYYSPEDGAIFFGYLPLDGGAELQTCLSHDVVGHETTHAVLDGLRPRLVGIIPGRLVPGADPSRNVVRAVYTDRNGTPFFLDQQRISTSGGQRPTGGLVRGDVQLFLNGDLPADSAGALAQRVR